MLSEIKKVIQILYACGPQSRRSDAGKVCFYGAKASELELGRSGKIIFSFVDFNGQVGKYVAGFEGMHEENKTGKRNVERKRLLEFFDERKAAHDFKR